MPDIPQALQFQTIRSAESDPSCRSEKLSNLFLIHFHRLESFERQKKLLQVRRGSSLKDITGAIPFMLIASVLAAGTEVPRWIPNVLRSSGSGTGSIHLVRIKILLNSQKLLVN
jgi:hypothetical protein